MQNQFGNDYWAKKAMTAEMEGNLGEAVSLLRKGAEVGEYSSVNHLLMLEEDGYIFLDENELQYYNRIRDKVRPGMTISDPKPSSNPLGCIVLIIIIAIVIYMIAK